MKQYNDYLKYLHHVDDTTLKEIKENVQKLIEELDKTKKHYSQVISEIEENHSKEIKTKEQEYDRSLEEIRERERKLIDERDTIKKSYEDQIVQLREQIDNKSGHSIIISIIGIICIITISIIFISKNSEQETLKAEEVNELSAKHQKQIESYNEKLEFGKSEIKELRIALEECINSK